MCSFCGGSYQGYSQGPRLCDDCETIGNACRGHGGLKRLKRDRETRGKGLEAILKAGPQTAAPDITFEVGGDNFFAHSSVLTKR